MQTNTLENTSAPCPRCESHASLEQQGPNTEPMCAACNEDQARCDAALDDLQLILEPVFKTWAERWTGEGVNVELLADLADDIRAFSPGPAEWVRNTTS